jgi:hypothetical protein
MNYYSNQEIEQVVEEPDRQPKPASSHVALNTHREAKPRNHKPLVKAAIFAGAVYLFTLIANVVQLPNGVLATAAGLLIGIFVYVSIKGEKNV